MQVISSGGATMKWILKAGIFFFFSTFSWAGETIRLTTGEFVPFTSESLKYNGVISRIVTEAFALEGIEVEYGWYPWKRAMALVKSGEWDGSSYWKKTPEREKDFYFSDVLTQSDYVFFHRVEKPFNWTNLEDLKKVSVGGTIGYFYQAAFEQSKLNVQWVSTDEVNLKKLLLGRIDVFPANIDATYYLLQKNFSVDEIKSIKYHKKPLSTAPSSLIFSKKIKRNERLIRLFNKGLKQLKDSEKYDKYFEESRNGDYYLP